MLLRAALESSACLARHRLSTSRMNSIFLSAKPTEEQLLHSELRFVVKVRAKGLVRQFHEARVGERR